MKYKDVQQIAIVYGKKDLVMEFIEIFEIDRMYDGAPIKAILVKGDMKAYLKNSIKSG